MICCTEKPIFSRGFIICTYMLFNDGEIGRGIKNSVASYPQDTFQIIPICLDKFDDMSRR